MKKFAVIWAFLCLFVLQAGENLLVNGKFTNGAKSWTFSSWTKTPGGREVKTEGDEHYLSIYNHKDNKFATLCVQQVKLKSDTTYMFKFRMRTKDVKRQLPNKVTHGAGISFTAGKYLFSGAARMWHMIDGTTGWTDYRGTFKTGTLKPSQLVSVYLSLTLATGTADFADISLEEIGEQPPPAASADKKKRVNLFPVEFQNGRYRIPRGFTATWDCTFTGQRPKETQSLFFELPAGFEIAGGAATRPAEDRDPFWKWSCETPRKEKLSGGMTRYTLTLPPHVMKDWRAWNNTYRVFVRATGAPGTRGAGRWYAGNDTPQPLNLEILPPLEYGGKVPEKFIICPSYIPNLVGAPEEIGKQHVELWKALSVPQVICIDPWAWRHVDPSVIGRKTAGFKKAIEIGSMGSMPRLGFARWKRNDPKTRNVKFPLCVPRSPREPDEVLCPDYLIRDPEGYIWDNYVPTLLRERAGKIEVDLIDFDLEPHPTRHCFCPVCLEEFAKFAKMKTVPTREQILARHSGTWFKFRVEQHRRIIRRYLDSCRKHFPGRKVSLVTDILHPTGSLISDWCAVDCRQSDSIGLDYMRNMPYFEGTSFYDTTAFNRKQLKTPWFPFIDPSEVNRRFYIRYTPAGVKLNIVATAMLGGVGIGFWPNDFFDGAYLHEMLRASRIVGAAEDFYMAGARCDDAVSFVPKNTIDRKLSDDGETFVMQTPDFAPFLRHTVHRAGDQLLLTVLNYHPEEDVILELASRDAGLVPRALAGCTPPERTADGKYLVKIKSCDAGIWVFSAENKAVPAGKLAAELEKFHSSASGKTTGGGLTYGLLRPEKIAMIKLTAEKRAVYIAPGNQALVMGWRSAASALNDLLDLRGTRGKLAELVVPFLGGREKFSARKTDGGIEFRYVVPAPEDANPEAEKYTGVEIVKRVTLADGGNTVDCEWEIVNPGSSGKAIEFFARIRNIPMPGALIPEGKLPGAAAEVSSGKLLSPVGSPISTVWHKENAVLEFSNAKREIWNGGKVRFSVRSFGEEEAVEFSFDDGCYGVHLWRENAGILTVEPLYRFKIPSGKKAVIRQRVTYRGIRKAGKKSDKYTGIVFEDKNGNGKRDDGEKGLAGIRVSNGVTVVQTAADGSFSIAKNEAARFIFASRPAGYKCSTPFYRTADSDDLAFGFAPAEKRPLVFYQVTDTEARRPETWLGEITALGKKDKGDFLLHSGDIVGLAGHAEKMPLCQMDVFVIPGNHDMESKGTEHTREAYEKHFGPVYYSFDAGNFRFFNIVYERNLKDPENQRAWLKRELALLPAGKKIVIHRHEPPQYGDRLIDHLFSEHAGKIAGFICGHTHSLLCRKFPGGIPVWECSPAPGGGLDGSPRAFRIFREVDGRLVSEVVHSDPGKVADPVVSPDPSAPAVRLGGSCLMAGFGSSRNAVVPEEVPPPLFLRWRADAGGAVHHAPPVICGGRIFVAASDNDNAEKSAVTAFDASDGKQLWRQTVGAAVKGGIASDGKNLYVCCVDGQVFSLRQSTGEILWKTAVADAEKTNGMYGAPVIDNGTLLLYNEAPVLIDCATGKIKYQGPTTRETGGVWTGGVAVSGNIGISGVSWRYGLKGFDTATGKILWNLRRGRDFTYLDASPVIAGGEMYFKGRKIFFVIDPATGKILRETAKPAGMETASAPAVAEKIIVFGSPDGLHALDRETLKESWHFKPGKALIPATPYHRRGYPEVSASPVIAGGTVICGALDGKLYVLDLTSGKVLWQAQLDSQIMARTAVSGNAVAAVTMKGLVYLFTSK